MNARRQPWRLRGGSAIWLLAALAACGGKVGASPQDGGTGSDTSALLPPPYPPHDGGSPDVGPTPQGDAAGLPDGGSEPPVGTQKTAQKVDVLFMVDNAGSNADAQPYLQASIPALITWLLQPPCLDASQAAVGACSLAANGACTCPSGQTLAFAPVTDLHLGVLTGALGGLGSDACPEPTPNPVNPQLDVHNNDNAHLVNRGGSAETPVADASGNGDNFLAWFPSAPANAGQPAPPVTAIGAETQLVTDFTELVSGVGQYGCGFPAQDEAWYRFLVEPNPYQSVSRDEGECSGGTANGMQTNTACLVGTDATILQQRHDFLRPDSAVVIVMVSSKDTGQAVDPLELSGQAWAYMDDDFPGGPGTAAMGTSACGPTPVMGPNPGPSSPNCTSCAFTSSAPVQADKAAGGNCSMNGGYYTATQDSLTLRGLYDKQRFGVDPRFPVSRYVTGLTSGTVPDRDHAHDGMGNYSPTNNCVNPLFAASLPSTPQDELCNLTPGPRGAGLVFLATVTGVPHQLLQAAPGSAQCPATTAAADCPQKTTLTASDWQLLLGANPENYDFTGIDPHMFLSTSPRMGLPPPATPGNGTDPINGREWNTGDADREYACTYPLVAPKDCTTDPVDCLCTTGGCDTCAMDPNCVCPPVCGDGTTAPVTTQVLGRAYPSPRELEEVKAMGSQGIVSSVCPIHAVDNAAGDDPLYAYRPAMSAIVAQLAPVLSP